MTVRLILLLVSLAHFASAQTAPHAKTYPLRTWSNLSCRSKGRFQDRDYCISPIIDQIVADGKSAVPVLISQITDARWMKETVYDYWHIIRVGELAYFILNDLFVDDTWTKGTIPPLFPPDDCKGPAVNCWDDFRKTHSLKLMQEKWVTFWKAHQSEIYWDPKARCFRFSGYTPK